MEMAQKVYTVAELATMLRCGRNQAYAFVASGAVRSIKVGSAIRIPAAEVDRVLGPKPDVDATMGAKPAR